MALQQIPGEGSWIPAQPRLTAGGLVMTSSLIDATGEKVAMVGRVWNKDHASKDITKVGFRFAAVTKAGGSALTVSLQDVSLATGPPIQPDGTQDQTVAIANADAGFVSNAWYQTGAFSAARTVVPNELLAIVIEYDGAGRLGADAVNLSSLLAVESLYHQSAALLNTGSWAASALIPNVILEFTDGTFGKLQGAFPLTTVGSVAFKQDTAGSDEYAMEFRLPYPYKIDAMWALLTAAATADFDVILYDGTTPITGGTVSVDGHSTIVAGVRYIEEPFPLALQDFTFAANTTYRLAIQPTQTAANVTLHYFDVANANHFQAHAGGTAWALTSRLNAGSWAAVTTTRRPMMGIRVCACDDGAGGGGLGNRIISASGGLIMAA